MSYNVKEKSQSWFGWLADLFKLTNKDKSKNEKTKRSLTWFQILCWRIKPLFFPGELSYLHSWVFFYRSYEPRWLANLTCPSTSLLSQVEDSIQKTIDEDELIIDWEKDTQFIEGGFYEHRIIFIHKDYANEVSESYRKDFLKKLIRNIWDLKSYQKLRGSWKGVSRFIWNDWGTASIEYAFIKSYIDSWLDTDSVEFETREQRDHFKKLEKEYWEGGDDDYTC